MTGFLKKVSHPVFAAGVALCLVCNSALAFDIQETGGKKSNPFEVFKFGLSAFKSGHKDEALKALRYAADQGHPGANWKLASMYAQGDGVPENDYEAYKIFEKIVHDGAEPGSQNESYVAGALVQLARYLKHGIPDTPVAADPNMAVDYYVQAASSFGDATAQYELGMMLFKGDGIEKNTVQAARWFQLAAKKGNANAQAMLGNMLFQAGKTVRGLAMLTTAFERCADEDCEWIRAMQEQAFSIAGEADRRNAIALAGGTIK
ncbi:tetratricopeptide repeat protein [Pseudochrobactrum sp. HB0163]|uniref:tetratricopeptide repeat protein n=1 Tax=Pseudochrobactrum sp. HB0163 TaxID=3450708 RepID=UPI003F6E290E